MVHPDLPMRGSLEGRRAAEHAGEFGVNQQRIMDDASLKSRELLVGINPRENLD